MNATIAIYNRFPNNNYCNGFSTIMARDNTNNNYSYCTK